MLIRSNLQEQRTKLILGGSGNFITINNNKGGRLRINSRVTDKLPGDFNYPVQYDTTNANWFVNSDINPTTNRIYNALLDNGADLLNPRTNKTFFTRKEDTRPINDKIYKLRYVIPKETSDARAPIPGFVIQDSNTVGVTTATDFTDNIPNATVQRNLRIVKSLDRNVTGVTTFVTEKPHNFEVGDIVKFRNIKSSGNPVGET